MVPLVTTILLVLVAAAAPASSVTVLIPALVDRAVALEKEGLKRAAPVATSGLVERFNAFENTIVGYEYVSVSGNHDLVVCGSPFDEIGVKITPEGVRVECQTPRGTVQRSLSLNPEHTYLILAPQGIHTIPVTPQHRGKELPILIVRGGRAYEPTTYFPSFILGDYAKNVTPLDQAVGLMGDWDLLVRLKIEGETVAFDLVRSDGSGAYRVVCDLRTGSAWREPLPPGEARRLLDLAREDLARLPKLRFGELRDETGLWLVVYDITEGRILLELASPSLRLLREYNPRSAELVELLRSVNADRLLKWDCLQLSACAWRLQDLLESAGLASTSAVRCLLHPELVLGSHLLAAGLGFAASLAWIELLESLSRLGEAPELRWEPSSLLEYMKRLAYVGVLYGLELVYWSCCGVVAEALLRALGLWDYTVGGRVVQLVRDTVWAPLIEEPAKRLMSELSGLPRWLTGALYGLLEALGYGEIRPSGVNMRSVGIRVIGHAVCATLPLPFGALLHSLWADESIFGDEFLEYWPGVLGPALAALGALAEHALTGVW